MTPTLLPANCRIGAVQLRVRDLSGVTKFYREALGMEVLAEDDATAALSGDRFGPPLVVLHAAEDRRRSPLGSPGLFHIGLRVPDRARLAGLIRRLHSYEVAVHGYADHNVSESVYLADPEGNGIEIYADRDPEVWRTVDEEIFITTEPLDLDGLLAASREVAAGFPAASEVGHVHLQVSSLAAAESFYVDDLGLTLVTRRVRGALFLASGSYHHHLGLNVWKVRPGVERSASGLGIISFELVVPDPESRLRLTGGADEGLVLDPDGIGVRITAAGRPRPNPRGEG